MDYIVYDLEWNWAKRKYRIINNTLFNEEIIQIGAIKLNDSFNIEDTFNEFVRPLFYPQLFQHVIDYTGINQTSISNAMNFKNVGQKFREWCGKNFIFMTWGGCDTIALCNNLRINYMDVSWIPPTFDLQLLYDLQTSQKGNLSSLAKAMRDLGEEPLRFHDAYNDAFNTALVLKHLGFQKSYQHCYACMSKDRKMVLYMKDLFSHTYSTIDEALKDLSLRTFPSYTDRTVLHCSIWKKINNTLYSASATNISQERFDVKLRLENTRKGIRAERIIYKTIPNNIHFSYA